jgi:hypothetical protein
MATKLRPSQDRSQKCLILLPSTLNEVVVKIWACESVEAFGTESQMILSRDVGGTSVSEKAKSNYLV